MNGIPPNSVRITTANMVTIARLVMVPCFALAVIYYAQGVKRNEPEEWQRWLAVALFALASLSDAVDGFIARRFNQKTLLGAILDPVADKALLLTALLILSMNFGNAFAQLPLWFPIVILSRDIFIVLGVALLWMMNRQIEIRPNFSGKAATFLQMLTLGLVLLKVPNLYWQVPLWAAGFLTIFSGSLYVIKGLHRFANW
ncbi:MAG: CDP-diacylglycerol--glycerol-3-phosphate 3-phosphatidyltransferase [Verrucomicrobiae bacterium]|nr:CDP-diacylglycerol--glycerol-3-phosphate 3-phosphatidyltransferase [Verrucomicrobiae bacterium]